MKRYQVDLTTLVAQARDLTNSGESSSAILVLEKILKQDANHAEANYLYGFNLHVYQKEYEQAVKYYQKSQRFGFDEFWVRYNLGSLYCLMNQYNEACSELEKAVLLDADHVGAKQVLRKAQSLNARQNEKLPSDRLIQNHKITRTAEILQHTILVNSGQIDEYEVQIPQSLKKFQPLNPLNFEEELYHGLKLVVRPQMVVFEAGSYCGVLTTVLARMVGENGQVHVFEASVESSERAKRMVEHNRLKNVVFQNVFLSEKTGDEQEFYAIRSSDGWAVSSADPGILRLYPEAERISVDSLAWDDYVRDSGVIPDVLKMDIEGAEYAALQGACELLSTHKPDIILEVHGDRMPGISGSTELLMETLAQYGYLFFDLETGVMMNAEEYSKAYPIYGHVLCHAKELDKEVLNRFSETIVSDLEKKKDIIEKRKHAREKVDAGEFTDAQVEIEKLLSELPEDADLLYLKAFCKHHTGQDYQEVLFDYQKAYENGFDEFWVRYHRANLFYQMADKNAAVKELRIAVRLNPAHEGARSLLKAIETEEK